MYSNTHNWRLHEVRFYAEMVTDITSRKSEHKET